LKTVVLKEMYSHSSLSSYCTIMLMLENWEAYKIKNRSQKKEKKGKIKLFLWQWNTYGEN